ncbi:hypothetical protein Glo7428_2988 [Gloeocapsa sp. PCC 7428]|uniref:BrnA antitoxin family protein n=1 Tax=Gloeocapsa sp. PCC 7428 TaxID=1173026 RepID=UPI0002A60606|nr:BrnA antitoxin family protein [Gloeocapsa sp. PCC 7428]AFZ31477.1 hypothetical protein Glo7428_2988 [Gloeocapsa sp. PCC 7428]
MPKEQQNEFPVDRARRVSDEETAEFRKAIEEQFGVTLRKRGRPAKSKSEKYVQVSLRLDPAVINWAKEQAEREGIGYQTVINNTLNQARKRSSQHVKK